MKTRPRYIPLIEVEADMVLGASTSIINSGVLRFSLPAGHVLTEDNLRQFGVHRAEFIFVAEPDYRSDEQAAVETARAARRVMHIFSGADLSDPTLASLFDQVLAYRIA